MRGTTDRVIGWISGLVFCVVFVTVAFRVGPQLPLWPIVVLVLAPLLSAAVSLGVERSIGTLRSVRQSRRDKGR